MEKFLSILTVATAGLFAAPTAEAGPRHVSVTYVNGSSHYGCHQVRTERYVAFHDRFGRPVFKYRSVPVRHRCHVVPRHRPVCGPVPVIRQTRVVHGPGYHVGPVIVARPVPCRY